MASRRYAKMMTMTISVRTAALPLVLAVGLSLALAGCATESSGATPTTETDASASPTTSAAPRGPSSPIEPLDAYALCKARTVIGLAPGDFSHVTYAPFDEATTLVRDDGFTAVYIEIVDPANTAAPEGSLVCKLRGPIGAPVWHTDAVLERMTPEDVQDILSTDYLD